MTVMTIRDEQTVKNIEELARKLGLSPEETVTHAVMETTARRERDKEFRMDRIDDRWGAVHDGSYQWILPEVDDLMYDDDGLPQ
jgi:hypothetical protein